MPYARGGGTIEASEREEQPWAYAPRSPPGRSTAGSPAPIRWAGGRGRKRGERPADVPVATADRVVKSVRPYRSVGCGQNVYVEDGRVTQIEGDPDSPGRLCPTGAASLQLTTGDARERHVRYRTWRPVPPGPARCPCGSGPSSPAARAAPSGTPGRTLAVAAARVLGAA